MKSETVSILLMVAGVGAILLGLYLFSPAVAAIAGGAMALTLAKEVNSVPTESTTTDAE